MKQVTRFVSISLLSISFVMVSGPGLAQDIVINSGTDETVISRLPTAGIEDQPVCSDSTDGTLGNCAPSLLGGSLMPFALTCFIAPESVTTSTFCATEAVPLGFTFVVEHLSGEFATGEDQVVDQLSVTSGNQVVRLPVHFVSRPLNFGAPLGIGQYNQYGSPATMYVPGGEALTVLGSSNQAGTIRLNAIGRLVAD